MQGSGGISNSLIELFGARLTAGFYLPGQFCPNEELFLPYPDDEPEVCRHLRLMEFLGVPTQGDGLEFPLYPRDWSDFRLIEKEYALQTGDYVCLHPGSRADTRRWPVERFAAVGDGMAARGMQVVLTGTHEEAHLTAAVSARMKAPSLDLAGLTNLGSLGALLSSARLLVCNDTGVSHIAAALRTPSVVLFTGSDPNRWAPKDQARHRIIAWATTAIPEIVLAEVDDLLRAERAYA
jgi:ADP-heptose:LPS heptosyltransferase